MSSLGFNSVTPFSSILTGSMSIVASSSLSGVLDVIPLAVFNAAPTPRTEAQVGPLQEDSLGNLNVTVATKLAGEDFTNDLIGVMTKPTISTTYSWTRFQNLGANTTLNVKASAGQLFSIYCHNITGSPRFFQFHNTATVPAASAVPLLTFLVPLSSSIVMGADWFGENGSNFSTGIAYATSLSESIYIAGAASDCIVQLNYV